MQSLLIAIFFVDMAILLGVGGRLLFTATRTRRAPEAAIGTSAAFGALGVILGMIATTVLARDPGAFPLWAAGRVATAVGACGLAVGGWRIYRPDAPWAAAVAAALCAVSLTGCALRVFPGTIPPPDNGASLGYLLSVAASIGVYGWSTGESLAYYLKLRRRLTLGLADRLTARRFLLWAISGGCALASSAASLLTVLTLGTVLSKVPPAFVAVQLALFLTSVCLWFAFFPPRFYRRRLSARAAA